MILKIMLLLLLLYTLSITTLGEESSNAQIPSYPPGISFEKFIGLVDTESENELNYGIQSKLEEGWKELIKFEWARSERESFGEENNPYPFIICYYNASLSGFDRREDLIESGLNE